MELNEFIAVLEEALGRTARKELLPMQPGDVEATWADIDALTAATGFAPVTPLREASPALWTGTKSITRYEHTGHTARHAA